MLTALILSLGLNLLLGSITLFSHKALERKNREQIRERQSHAATTKDLLDRLMHSEGRTWTPPPVSVPTEEVIDEETKLMMEGWKEV